MTGDRDLMVLMTRLEALQRAITARDWDGTEFQYDRVLSLAGKMAGTRGRPGDAEKPRDGAPELAGQTWTYRFTMPRRGWPIVTWPHPSRTVRMQVREIIATVRSGQNGTLEPGLLRVKGRWVPSGRPIGYQTMRMPPSQPGPGAPVAPEWMLELVSAAVQAAGEQS